jgi:putative methyltransferase (TIGR04325 family)
MSMSVRRVAKGLVPPLLVEMVRKMVGATGMTLEGRYATWDQAVSETLGYEDHSLVERAAQKLQGWSLELTERDFQIAAAIMSATLELGKKDIHVVDYGGELGRYYFSTRSIVPSSIELRWTVVETPSMVSIGKSRYENDELSFSTDRQLLSSADVVCASGVLQCLENPREVFREVHAPYICVTIFPFISETKDVLTARFTRVPGHKESYPIWLFSDTWMDLFQMNHEIVMQWGLDKSDEFEGRSVRYKGFLLRRIAK